jgi:hypothetical protein
LHIRHTGYVEAAALSLVVLLVSGCAETERTGLDLLNPTSIDDFLEGVHFKIGFGAEHDELRWFSRIRDAAFIGSNHIAVLDEAPPYLRIFDFSGALVEAYLPRGGGPGEAERPHAVAANQRLELLVLHDGRASLLSLDDGFVGTDRIPGVLATDVGWGCNGWLVYGPGNWASGERHWAHVLAFGPNGIEIVASSLADDAKSTLIPNRPGRVAGGTGDWILHDIVRPFRILPGCKAASSSQIANRALADAGAVLYRPPPAAPRRGSDGVDFGIRAGDITATGFSRFGTDVLMSAGIWDPDGEFDSLVMYFTQSGPMSGSSSRGVRIADVSPDGQVLLTVRQPVPHVIVLPIEELLANLRGSE